MTRQHTGRNVKSGDKERPRIVVIGLGNDYRGDDAAGPVLARRLAEEGQTGVDVSIMTSAFDLLGAWQDADAAIVLDAMDLGEKSAGRICRFEYPDEFFSENTLIASTHSLGLADITELAHRLDRLPPTLIVYGIAGRSFDIGTPLSPAVECKLDEVLRRVIDEITLLAGNP